MKKGMTINKEFDEAINELIAEMRKRPNQSSNSSSVKSEPQPKEKVRK